jgi:hypothetical protein
VAEADELALAGAGSICSVARTSAERVAQAIHTDMKRSERASLRERQANAARARQETSEASYRAALRHVGEFCMAANDIETSRMLVQGIQAQAAAKRSFSRICRYSLIP